MSGKVIKLFDGDERYQRFYDELRAFVYEAGDGLPIPGVLGVIKMVETDILEDAKS